MSDESHFTSEEGSQLPVGFTEADRAVLDEEVNNVAKAVNILQDRTLNSAAGNFHAPPALYHVCTDLTIGAFPRELFASWDDDDYLRMIAQVASLGTFFFDLGQQCAQMGVLSANMEPCRCHKPSDNDIAKLLEGH